MRSERATFKVIPRMLIVVRIVISEMQIHSLAKKPQSNGRHLSIILGWTDNHAYEAFSVTKVGSAML